MSSGLIVRPSITSHAMPSLASSSAASKQKWSGLPKLTTVQSAPTRLTNACVVVDQSWPFASIGAEIASQIHAQCFDDLDNHVYRVHSDDVPTPYAYNLEQAYLPNTHKICEAIRAATYNA